MIKDIFLIYLSLFNNSSLGASLFKKSYITLNSGMFHPFQLSEGKGDVHKNINYYDTRNDRSWRKRLTSNLSGFFPPRTLSAQRGQERKK